MPRTHLSRPGSSARRALGVVLALAALGLSSSAATYVVRPGDTLSGIASRTGVSVGDLARTNGITDPNRVFAGQTLTLPGTGGAATPTAPAATAPAPGRTHVVAAGETLSSIAGKYGTTVRAIVDANGITDPNHVRIGTRLQIPTVAQAAPTGGLPARLQESPARLALIPHFKRWAEANGIDAALLMAVCWHESGWQNDVVSPVGARGIGQLMPGTAEFVSEELIGVPLDPNVPEENIRMSARYLRFLLSRVDGDVRLALAGYFQGPGSVAARGLLPASEQYVQVIQNLRPRFVGV